MSESTNGRNEDRAVTTPDPAVMASDSDKSKRIVNRMTNRRDFLGTSAGLMGVGVLSQSSEAVSGGDALSFAVVADSHIDPHVPEHSDNLASVFASITDRPEIPHSVLHVGDIVESGSPAQYEEYDRLEPAILSDRISAVPGNHEFRWDQWATHEYHDRFGATPYSFDAGGIHFIGLDPTSLLHEGAYFDRHHVEWLKADLRATGTKKPIVMFVHFPMGAGDYFVANQDTFWNIVEPYNVRALFAGHVHYESVRHQNGMAVISMPAILEEPSYHWVKKETSKDGTEMLRVSHVNSETSEERSLVEVPLSGPVPSEDVKPDHVTAKQIGDEVRVRVGLPPNSHVADVQCQWWPEEVYAWGTSGDWKSLSRTTGATSSETAQLWETTLPTDERSAGESRIQVRAIHQDDPPSGHFGVWWDGSASVTLDDQPTTLTQIAEHDLRDPVQADLTTVSPDQNELVVTTTYPTSADGTPGRVTAYNASEPKRTAPVWEFETKSGEGVVSAPTTNESDETVFVGTTSNRVLALDAATGEKRWASRFDSPVLGDLVWAATKPFTNLLLVPAGQSVYAVDATTGERYWEVDVGGFTAGKPGIDEDGVYVGSGDGNAYGIDLETGEKRWRTTIAAKSRPYRTMIYGPWNTTATVVPSEASSRDLVTMSTVTETAAFDCNTGKVVWRFEGGYMYADPLYIPGADPTIVYSDEWGGLLAVDPATGTEKWSTEQTQRILGTSPNLWKGSIYLTGIKGTVYVYAPDTGEQTDEFSVSTDYVFSSHVSASDSLFVGGQDGRIDVLQRR